MKLALSFLILIIGVSDFVLGQCEEKEYNFSSKMTSDEAFAYSLVSYVTSDSTAPSDSLFVYSPYKFNDDVLFPKIWAELKLLSETPYRSIQRPGYHLFLETILKDANVTIIKANLFVYKDSEIELLRAMSKKICLTDDGSSSEYFRANRGSDFSIYFN